MVNDGELSNINGNYNFISSVTETLSLINVSNNGVLTGLTTMPITSEDVISGAFLNYTTYGGIGNLTFNGNQPHQFLSSGETFFSYFTDENGCQSNLVSGVVLCPPDPCLFQEVVETIRVTTSITETTETLSCPDIALTWALDPVELPNDGSPSTYSLSLRFENFVADNIDYFDGIITFPSYPLNEPILFTGNIIQTYHSISATVFNTQTVDFLLNLKVYINGKCGVYDYEVLISLPFDDSAVGNALITKENIVITNEVSTIVTETVYELIGGTPILSSNISCADNVATVNLTVSGGTAPFNYYGLIDGQEITENGIYSVYVEDSNGCKSDVIEVLIDCITEVNCSPITLISALETTSSDDENNTSTLTYSYRVDFTNISDRIDEVGLTVQGINGSELYMLGNPVIQTFSTDFGAKQIFFNYNPFSPILTYVKIFMVVKLENGCIYSSVHELSVDGSTLMSRQEQQFILDN